MSNVQKEDLIDILRYHLQRNAGILDIVLRDDPTEKLLIHSLLSVTDESIKGLLHKLEKGGYGENLDYDLTFDPFTCPNCKYSFSATIKEVKKPKNTSRRNSKKRKRKRKSKKNNKRNKTKKTN